MSPSLGRDQTYDPAASDPVMTRGGTRGSPGRVTTLDTQVIPYLLTVHIGKDSLGRVSVGPQHNPSCHVPGTHLDTPGIMKDVSPLMILTSRA